ncbi:GPW/gp25 family protein [Tropicimonas sp. IMCC34043]|uniref:GPW/gp25 family protein n=1 Tax=Tropicimonas sp. IMCC34043 TaxID=2248760 RepID=UPI000E220607|nr:GPW/gp25 family protein [Tropicimonas sp. IMCC34043]
MDLNDETGGTVEGWPHVVQSIRTLLATRLETRVFRRDFGSDVPQMIDAPANDAGTMALYVAVAEAIDTWEPRFDLSDVGLAISADGVAEIRLHGSYLPRGHLGDTTRASDGSITVSLAEGSVKSWSDA